MLILGITGLALLLAGMAQAVIATRSLRAYERDAGRLEAEGTNGSAILTTLLLIDTERLRLGKATALTVLALFWLFLGASDTKRFVIAGCILLMVALDTYKGVLWRRIHRRVVELERARHHAEPAG